MEKDKKINLDEALKQFYSDEPLKINLAATVADKVFAKKKSTEPAGDKWVSYLIIAVCSGIIIFLFRYLVFLTTSPAILLLLLPVVGYYWLSVKEVSILSNKYMQSGL